MAHELNSTDHMFSAGVTPWHGLGTVTDDTLDLDTALVTAKLNWTVSKHPAFTRDNDTSWEEILPRLIEAHTANPGSTFGELLQVIEFDLAIPETFATVRDDLRMPLAPVGKDYTVWQNWQNFDLAKTLMDGGAIKAETAGSLRNSRTVWLLCRLDKEMSVGGDETIPYLLFTSSHDGSSKIRVMPTPVRVVCNNTLRFALASAKSEWTASHTSSVNGRAQEARETLALTWKYLDSFELEVQRLQDQVVSDLEFERIVFELVPDPTPNKDGEVSARGKRNASEKRGTLRQAWERSPEVGEFRGTGWGVAMAANTVDLWTGRVHGGEENRLNRQAQRILRGETMANTSKVLELLSA